jgi:hypothetical protein
MRPALRTVAGGLGITTAMAVGLSACSSSPSPTRTTTTTTHHPGPPTRSTTTTAPTPPPSTTTTAAVATCQLPGLQIAEVGQSGAAGTQEITFAMTNTSGAPCTTYGYPGLLLVAPTGAAMPTTVVRGGGLTFESIAPSQVTLAPGQPAYFNVGFSDVQSGTTTCSSTHTVEVTPPTTTTHATVGVGLGIYACDDGTLHVSAVFPSTSASGTQTTAPPS